MSLLKTIAQVIVGITLLALMACGSTQTSGTNYMARELQLLAQTPAASVPDPELIAALSGRTHRQWGEHFGSSVEYMAPDGSTWLWTANRNFMYGGEWTIVGNVVLCFNYWRPDARAGANPPDGYWPSMCRPVAQYLAEEIESVEGDPLGLENREPVPFVLGHNDPSTIEELAERLSQQ